MDVQNADKLLEEVSTGLDSLGIQHVLTFGTCLGIIRDGSLMPWDDDLDIGIFHDVLVENINRIHDYFLERDFIVSFLDHPYSYKRMLKVKKYGIRCDLINFDLQGDNRFSVIHDQLKSWVVKKHYFDNVKQIMYRNKLYTVPFDTEGYLEATYGKGWCTPKPDFCFSEYSCVVDSWLGVEDGTNLP